MEDTVKDFDPYSTNAAVLICPREIKRRREMCFYGENFQKHTNIDSNRPWTSPFLIF